MIEGQEISGLEIPTQAKEIKPLTAEQFATTLVDKGIPVDGIRATEVGNIILDEGGNPLLLGKLAECFRYIGKAEFEQDVTRMAKSAIDTINGRDYNLALHYRRGKSGDWIVNQLYQQGLQKPATEMDVFNWPKYNREILRPTLFIDDWSISGLQALEVIEKVKSIAREWENEDKPNNFQPEIHTFLLYSNVNTTSQLERAGAQVHQISEAPLTRLYDSLTPQDREVLRKIRVEERAWKQDVHVRDSTTLTFRWWRIPDNFYELFVYPSPLGLIQIENFFPPYKDRKQLKQDPNASNRLVMPY